jgi:uncharacterized protein YxjI
MGRRRGRRGDGPAPVAAPAAAAPASGPERYKVRQQMIAIGNDFWIENERGQKLFKVDGKALRLRATLLFQDARGQDLYKIQTKVARVRDTMAIEDASGRTAFRVHNALITPLRDRWAIDVPGGQDLTAQGNILQHQFRIERGRGQMAQVSKKWFRVRDTYGVEVYDPSDAAAALVIAIVIDMMAHPSR